MILAAGYGTRLFPLTADRAKPALPFLNQPLVGFVAKYLSGYGVRECLVNLHHQGETVRRVLGDGARFGVTTRFIEEPEILGTSGALDNAKHLLDKETFIAINGKIITDINLHQALETHRRTNALATLILRRNVKRERFSIVNTEGELITGFGGMPAPHDAATQEGANQDLSPTAAPLMFTGIQILEPRIFDYIPRGVFSHSTTQVYPAAMKCGERIIAHVAEAGDWYELSTPQRYLKISLELAAKDLNKTRTDDSQESDKAESNESTSFDDKSFSDDKDFNKAKRRFIVGADSRIDKGAQVGDSILWERVVIESGARVERSIIGDDVHIKSGARYADAIVVRADLIKNNEIPAKALSGRFEGNHFVASLAQ